MEESLLIENRNSLKDIFYRHLAEKEASNISYKQFFKFCCTVKIYPDLISSFELKRILSSTLKKKILDEKTSEISYQKFEKLLGIIAEHCFPSLDSMRLMLTHIKGLCQIFYHANLVHNHTLSASKGLPLSKSNFKLLATTRTKNISSLRRKLLNKSTSQKLSLSGLISPKIQSVMYKEMAEFKSPSS